MTKNENEALLHVMGIVDGTLEPQPLEGDSYQADRQTLAAYNATGAVALINSHSDAAGRKRFERATKSLAQTGMIFQNGKHAGLTPEGDSAARRLAGLPTLKESLHLLAAVVQCRDKWTYNRVSESSLCGLEPIPAAAVGTVRTPENRFNMLLPFMAPLLAARLVEWFDMHKSDVILYAATPAGLPLSKKGNAADWFKAISRPRRIVAPERYYESLVAAYNARQHATPLKPCLVVHRDLCDPPRRRRCCGAR